MPFPKEQNHCLFFTGVANILSFSPQRLEATFQVFWAELHPSSTQEDASTKAFTIQGQGWCWKCRISLHRATFHPSVSNRAGPRQSLRVLQRLVNVHHLCWIVPARAPLNVLEKQLLLEAL